MNTASAVESRPTTIVVATARDAFGGGMHGARPSDVVLHCGTVSELLRCVREHACDLVVIGAGFATEPVITAVKLACSYAPVLVLRPDASPTLVRDYRLDAWVARVPTTPDEFVDRIQMILDDDADVDADDVSQERVIDVGRRSAVITQTIARNAQLTHALDALWMAFQPIVSVRERSVRAFEALMRTTDSGYASPLAILDEANKLDRLWDVGRAARARTAERLVDLPENSLVFVNLHVTDLFDDALLHERNPLAPLAHRTVLEVTEQASVHELHELPQRVALLRERGYRIAVDDLGAGYSALSVLALLEPEFVKIDMSMVRNIDQSLTKQRVIRSLRHLSDDLGSTVICEGVETQAELRTLIDLGCDWIQGYLFARPAREFAAVDFEAMSP